MARSKIKATRLSVGLPFNLGSIEFENDVVQQQAAWAMYVELSTRIATIPLDEKTGILREALTSLYKVFDITRQILREAGPEIAKGPKSLGAIAIDVLNKGLRPLLVKWHPMLKAHEEKKPDGVTTVDHERAWEHAATLHTELEQVRQQMVIYVGVLAKIAGIVD